MRSCGQARLKSSIHSFSVNSGRALFKDPVSDGVFRGLGSFFLVLLLRS